MNPVGKNQWDIIEVKSSTSVKDVNLHDLALQRYTYKGAGLLIRKCIVMYINNTYVRNGELDAEKLFIQADVTNEVSEILPRVESDLEQMINVIGQKKSPDVPIGPHCSNPYDCPLTDMCWKFLPKENPTTLYLIRAKKAFELIHDGFTSIKKLPPDMKFNEKQKIQVASVQKKKPYADRKALRDFLTKLEYPLYFPDFETMAPAVPLFDNSSPFKSVPFQFSLHVQRKPGSAPEHYGFLAEGQSDPRKKFLAKLQDLLGNEGSIIVYNKAF